MSARWFVRLVRPFHRIYRWLRGLDNCERCDGTRGIRGNENVIAGIVTCDYCHVEVRWYGR